MDKDKLVERLEDYDPKLSPDNYGDELELHRDIVMLTGIGSMNPPREQLFPRSIDAAMTLVPEGCGWRIWVPAKDSAQPHRATIWAARGMPVFSPFDCEAATPALALCAAALRSHAQPKEG